VSVSFSSPLRCWTTSSRHKRVQRQGSVTGIARQRLDHGVLAKARRVTSNLRARGASTSEHFWLSTKTCACDICGPRLQVVEAPLFPRCEHFRRQEPLKVCFRGPNRLPRDSAPRSPLPRKLIVRAQSSRLVLLAPSRSKDLGTYSTFFV